MSDKFDLYDISRRLHSIVSVPKHEKSASAFQCKAGDAMVRADNNV
jgi:hypothetical protein